MSEELKTERVTIMMTPSEVTAIDDWSFARRIRSRGEAVRRLVEMGLGKLLSITPDLAKAIADYRYQHRITTESEATRRLIQIGLEASAKSPPAARPAKRSAAR